MLPARRLLWETLPYLSVVAGVAVLTAMTWRLAGFWAAGLTVAIGLAMSTSALYASVAPAFHGLTWATTAVLGAYALRERSLRAGAAVALVAGVNLASDPLLLVSGVLPLAVVAVRARDRRAIAASGTAVAVGLATSAVAGVTGVRAAAFGGFGLTAPEALGGRLLRGLDDVAALVNAGPLESAHGLRLAARIALAALALAAVAAVVVGLGRDRYRCFWAASASCLCAAFLTVGAPLGAGTPSARYLVGLVFAAAAVVPLRARGAVVVALGVGVCALGVVSLARGDLAAAKAHVAVLQDGRRVVAALERQGLGRGYGAYWQAAPLTWQSGGRVLVAPVVRCGNQLCAGDVNTVAAWYRPRASSSFLVLDPNTDRLGSLRSLDPPQRVERFGALRVYVYSYDIGASLGPARRHAPRLSPQAMTGE